MTEIHLLCSGLLSEVVFVNQNRQGPCPHEAYSPLGKRNVNQRKRVGIGQMEHEIRFAVEFWGISLRFVSEDVKAANRYAGLELREKVWPEDVVVNHRIKYGIETMCVDKTFTGRVYLNKMWKILEFWEYSSMYQNHSQWLRESSY